MNSLVSIIMPAHNADDTIEYAINSVLNQTYTDWELLIINDCSTDKTVLIVEQYMSKDSRIKLFHTDRSLGKPFYPRNIGIAKARGRFIAFLDSDDAWFPSKLMVQIPLFDNDKVGIVFSNYEKVSSAEMSSVVHSKRYVIGPQEVVFDTALYGNPIGNLTAIYDVLKVNKIYYIDAGHEDYILWLTILKQGVIAKNTNTVEARYRISETSVSANKMQAAKWTWRIYRNILELTFIESCWCYLHYIFNGIFKYIK